MPFKKYFFAFAFFISSPNAVAQSGSSKLLLLSGKIEMLLPAALHPMTESEQELKYRVYHKDANIYTDKNLEVNFAISNLNVAVTDDKVLEASGKQISASIKSKIPGISVIAEGMTTLSGKKAYYLEFNSPVPNGSVFNKYLFFALDKKGMLMVFNSVDTIESTWKPEFEKMISSIRFH